MIFPQFHSTQYSIAEKVYATDRLVMALGGRFVPASITPNQITLFRMIATPAVIALLVIEQYSVGVPLFLSIAYTDALDGALARTRNMITEWGKMFDPLADKLLIVPTVVFLVFHALPMWVGAVVIAIELLIIVLAFAWRSGGREVKANVWGKIKMILQVAGIFALLLSAWLAMPFEAVAAVLLLTSIVFAVISMLRYGI